MRFCEQMSVQQRVLEAKSRAGNDCTSLEVKGLLHTFNIADIKGVPFDVMLLA
jgi:hypothetical protein